MTETTETTTDETTTEKATPTTQEADVELTTFGKIRGKGLELAYLIRHYTDEGRSQALANTHLDTALLWANQAVEEQKAKNLVAEAAAIPTETPTPEATTEA
jgi:hypothetical protein